MVTAAPWRRLLATFFDFMLLSMVLSIFSLLPSTVAEVLNFCALILYTIILESSTMQATIGQYFLKIKVISLQGERITIMRSFGRYLIGILLWLFLGIVCIGIPLSLGLYALLENYSQAAVPADVLKGTPFLTICLLIGAELGFLCLYICAFFVRLCSKGTQTLQDYFSGTLLQVNETEQL